MQVEEASDVDAVDRRAAVVSPASDRRASVRDPQTDQVGPDEPPETAWERSRNARHLVLGPRSRSSQVSSGSGTTRPARARRSTGHAAGPRPSRPRSDDASGRAERPCGEQALERDPTEGRVPSGEPSAEAEPTSECACAFVVAGHEGRARRVPAVGEQTRASPRPRVESSARRRGRSQGEQIVRRPHRDRMHEPLVDEVDLQQTRAGCPAAADEHEHPDRVVAGDDRRQPARAAPVARTPPEGRPTTSEAPRSRGLPARRARVRPSRRRARLGIAERARQWSELDGGRRSEEAGECTPVRLRVGAERQTPDLYTSERPRYAPTLARVAHRRAAPHGARRRRGCRSPRRPRARAPLAPRRRGRCSSEADCRRASGARGRRVEGAPIDRRRRTERRHLDRQGSGSIPSRSRRCRTGSAGSLAELVRTRSGTGKGGGDPRRRARGCPPRGARRPPLASARSVRVVLPPPEGSSTSTPPSRPARPRPFTRARPMRVEMAVDAREQEVVACPPDRPAVAAVDRQRATIVVHRESAAVVDDRPTVVLVDRGAPRHRGRLERAEPRPIGRPAVNQDGRAGRCRCRPETTRSRDPAPRPPRASRRAPRCEARRRRGASSLQGRPWTDCNEARSGDRSGQRHYPESNGRPRAVRGGPGRAPTPLGPVSPGAAT